MAIRSRSLVSRVASSISTQINLSATLLLNNVRSTFDHRDVCFALLSNKCRAKHRARLSRTRGREGISRVEPSCYLAFKQVPSKVCSKGFCGSHTSSCASGSDKITGNLRHAAERPCTTWRRKLSERKEGRRFLHVKNKKGLIMQS